MLNIATICMLIAVIILYVCACFFNKNKALSFLLQAFCLISLLCLGIVVANSQNNFSAYVIFLIVAVVPQFLGLFDLQAYINGKQSFSFEPEKEDEPEKEEIEKAEGSDEELTPSQEEIDTNEDDAPAKKEKKHHFKTSKGELLNGVACFLSAICVTFAGLYVGLETFYGALLGVAIGFALMFLYLALKKEINLVD
ncbi:MAG: hypothetical protein J6J24_03460, partial [Clostridia bacterium]|nr:hypothetical protein [Clostridia bacterium]